MRFLAESCPFLPMFGSIMLKISLRICVLVALGCVCSPATAQVYELRTYKAMPGKLDALNARFRDHTVRLV